MAEDRLKRLRAAEKKRGEALREAELDGYYKRKHGEAASSSADGSKRKATEKQNHMEVDAVAGEVSDVDFDEVHEC